MKYNKSIQTGRSLKRECQEKLTLSLIPIKYRSATQDDVLNRSKMKKILRRDFRLRRNAPQDHVLVCAILVMGTEKKPPPNWKRFSLYLLTIFIFSSIVGRLTNH